MGLTKQYLRYVPGAVFNVVGSAKSNVAFVATKGLNDRFVAVGSCENVFVWDIRKGERVANLRGAKSEVTELASAPDGKHLAVAYTDGSVRIFNRYTGECEVTFQGHKSQVSCIAYDTSGARLVTGGKDTEIVVWDVVNEAGLFRLRGHKGVVTRCCFMRDHNILVSSSKDTFVKFWDLDTQHCFKTLVGHRSEVWDLVMWADESRLVTGASDSELRIWKIHFKQEEEEPEKDKDKETEDNNKLESEEDSTTDICKCIKLGSIMRRARDHVTSLKLDSQQVVLGCHGTDATLELFKLLSGEELSKRRAKRLKKAVKKMRLDTENSDVTSASGCAANEEQSIQDEVMRLPVVKASAKIKAFDMYIDKMETLKLILLLGNNTLEIYSVNIIDKGAIPQMGNKLHLPGHRTDVRTLCFSSDNTGIISASGESVKIWNRSSQQCIRTMPCEYALCCLFVPGDRHCIIGAKSGKMQIYDIAGSRLLESVSAHEGALWSLCLTSNKRGFASGGADKEVKFWDFELVVDSESDARKRLSVCHVQTLKMAEDVLAVKFSSDGRLIAVSLLDSTVKIFFTDTLKFFLTLYGHKFPVLCMDICDDSTLIATGSADRNIKIWGLDFGDCHKSIFAHDDSVMCMQFVPQTHMLFSGGKDAKVKLWDLDTFEKISTFEGHHGEVWALAVSPNGQHVVSASHDKSLRLWEKSQEILVLEEEKEMEREAEYEKGMVTEDEPVIAGETNTEAGLAGKKTLETVAAADRIIEALEIYTEGKKSEKEAISAGGIARPPEHPLLVAYKTPSYDHFMLHVLKQIKSSELEEALLVLPFSSTIQLLEALGVLLERGWEVELVCRCLFFLLRVHHGQITSNRVLLPTIQKIRTLSTERVRELRDMIGFNLAGMRYMMRELEVKEEVQFFFDATQKHVMNKRKQKKREAAKQRAILTI